MIITTIDQVLTATFIYLLLRCTKLSRPLRTFTHGDNYIVPEVTKKVHLHRQFNDGGLLSQ
jgi:hypothetical protein